MPQTLLNRLKTWLRKPGPATAPRRPRPAPISTVADVEKHYEERCQDYAECYGEILQAHRPADVEEMLQLEMSGMQLTAGMKLLDAGCGFCGPAIWFAQRCDVTIHGVTLAANMAERARTKVREAGLEGRIDVRVGDFHRLLELYPDGDFDRVYFLETFGYAKPFDVLARSAYAILKPGGCVYIKDWSLPDWPADSESPRIAIELQRRIGAEYGFQLLTNKEACSVLVNAGFEIVAIRPLGFTMDPTVMNRFDDRTGTTWRELVPQLLAPNGRVLCPFDLLARRPA